MPENEDDFTSDFNGPMRSRHNSLVKTSKSFVRRRNISLNLDLSGQGDEIDQNRSVSFENVAVGQTVAHEFCNGATVSESQVASEAERVVRSFMITAHQHYLFSLEDENFEGSSHSPFLALDISPIPELEYLDEDFLIAEDGTSPLRFNHLLDALFDLFEFWNENLIEIQKSFSVIMFFSLSLKILILKLD